MSAAWFCCCDNCLKHKPWEQFGLEPPPPPAAIRVDEVRTSNKPNYKGIRS